MCFMSLVNKIRGKQYQESNEAQITNTPDDNAENTVEVQVEENNRNIPVTHYFEKTDEEIPRGTAYLIDSENIGLSWLDILDDMGESDTIYVFFANSKNSPKISYNDLSKMMSCGVLGERKKHVEFVTCVQGKDAVDKQMCVMYGYLIAKNRYKDIQIVSQDSGFAFATNMGDRLMNVEANMYR